LSLIMQQKPSINRSQFPSSWLTYVCLSKTPFYCNMTIAPLHTFSNGSRTFAREWFNTFLFDIIFGNYFPLCHLSENHVIIISLISTFQQVCAENISNHLWEMGFRALILGWQTNESFMPPVNKVGERSSTGKGRTMPVGRDDDPKWLQNFRRCSAIMLWSNTRVIRTCYI